MLKCIEKWLQEKSTKHFWSCLKTTERKHIKEILLSDPSLQKPRDPKLIFKNMVVTPFSKILTVAAKLKAQVSEVGAGVWTHLKGVNDISSHSFRGIVPF